MFLAFVLTACSQDVSSPVQPTRSISTSIQSSGDSEIVGVLPQGDAINRALKARGVNAKLNAVFLIVNSNYPPGKPTVYVVDRTRYLAAEFVANDPRRGPVPNLTWIFDERRGAAQTLVNGVPATWTTAQSVAVAQKDIDIWTGQPCYKAFIGKIPYPPAPGYENIEFTDDYFLGGESQPFLGPAAEITFGGFLPYTVFRFIFGNDNILGVTYQFAFTDSNGQPTDIDHNGKPDAFWTEIYFNDGYYWGDADAAGFDPNAVLDMTAVGLHESGHAFGLGHLGTEFENHGGFHISAFNIMTQYYLPGIRRIDGVASAAFCGIYGSWH